MAIGGYYRIYEFQASLSLVQTIENLIYSRLQQFNQTITIKLNKFK